MPRANRHFLPGHVWHITHRCHKKEFLLKFARDRKTWIQWLFEARKRYGLKVLNYAVTSNHIHLLVYGDTDAETIPRSVQLVAGRTAQAYNRRKNRKGAFWEDRYHATAVDTDEHLLRCMAYIDLNMVRAGAATHAAEWPHCGYHEIIDPPRRYRILDRDSLKQLLGKDENNLAKDYFAWMNERLVAGTKREALWTESIATGSREFISDVKEKLGISVVHRDVQTDAGGNTLVLKEAELPYKAHLGPEMEGLSAENGHFWRVFDEI